MVGMDVREAIRQSTDSNVLTLLLLGENHHHYLGNLQTTALEALNTLDIKVLQVEVMNVISWVAAKELILIKETEGKTLEALIKFLDVVLACLFFTMWEVPAKDVMRVTHLMLTHSLMITPEASLDKVHLHFLLPLVLHREPYVCFRVQLIYKFKERASLEQPVANLVFNICKDLEELSGADLGITQDVA